MKKVEAMRPLELRHSQLLDQLIIHDDPRIRFETAAFVDIFRPPADVPLFSHALNRLEKGLIALAEHMPGLKPLVDHELLGLRLMAAAAGRIPDCTERVGRPVEKRLRKFPAYCALLMMVEDDVESLRAISAEFLRCKLSKKRIPAQFGNAVRRGSHSPAPELANRRNASKSWDESHKSTLRWLKDHVYGTEDSGREFQKAACRSFMWRTKLPGLSLRRGLVHHRSLTVAGFKQAAESLRLDLIDAVPLATGIAAAFLSGVSWDLAQHIPLKQPDDPDWVIWLDVQAGCFHCDLTPIVRGAARARGNDNYQPATRAFPRYLPKNLVDALLRRQQICPDALTLGELCQSYGVPPEHVIGAPKECGFKTSIARFFNSRSHVSKMLEMSAPMAALALGEFARVPHGRLFYHSSTPHQINDALSGLAKLLGWGPIRPLDLDDPFVGSVVVPQAESIMAIAQTLAALVESARPSKRYSLKQIKRFHNAFVDYTIFLVSLGVLGRDRASLLIQTHGETGVTGLHDKLTCTSKGATPVVICGPLRDQIMHFILHCRCLLKRLDKLGVVAKRLREHIELVISGDVKNMFFQIDEYDNPQARGSHGVYADLPKNLRVKADSARHFWDTEFALNELSDDLADAQARRVVRGARHWSSTGTICADEMRNKISSIQEQVLEHLQIMSIAGLRK